jgi:hypothetical protein
VLAWLRCGALFSFCPAKSGFGIEAVQRSSVRSEISVVNNPKEHLKPRRGRYMALLPELEMIREDTQKSETRRRRSYWPIRIESPARVDTMKWRAPPDGPDTAGRQMNVA